MARRACRRRVERPGPAAGPGPACVVNNIEVVYDHVILVLKGVSLQVPEGGVVALLGANGAGKTTTLKAISNLLRAERGEVTKGTITLAGEDVAALVADRAGPARRRPGDGGPPLLRAPDGRGEPADRRLHAQGRQGRDRSATSTMVYGYFPRLRGAAPRAGRLHLGRRAADDRDRPRADGAAQGDPARRALDGPGAAAGRGDLRDRRAAQPRGRRHLPARRAEHQRRAALRPLRLHPGERPGGARRRRRGAARQRGRQGVLSRPRRRRAARASATSRATSAASAGFRTCSDDRQPSPRQVWRSAPASRSPRRCATTARRRAAAGRRPDPPGRAIS